MGLNPATRASFLAGSVLASLAWGPAPVRAAPPADKSDYSWLNPTPDGLLREFTTDRPDVTESPFTVDAGHMQLEMDLANYTSDRQDGVSTTEWGVAPFNLRLGLGNDFEAGVFLSPWIRRRVAARAGSTTTVLGFGDVVLRGKWNFLGNDGGGLAYGLIADLKLPTAADGLGNGRVEAAVTLPVTVRLAAGWDLNAMAQLQGGYDDAARGYRPFWLNSVSVDHDLGRAVAGYVELTSLTGDGPQAATLDVGITWLADRGLQLDAGVNLGVSRTAPDLLVFSGLSRRF